ncbi:MAG: ATP synthase F1 subunit delta [Bdellovibrionaceae bacterium]|nr:ATP synthase F1 subunit delta [Pseudobdellovibrionaceae bacterium]
MKKTKLAQTYSKAYYSLAMEQACIKEVLKDCNNLLALFEKEPSFLLFFDNQVSSIKKQKQALQVVLDKFSFHTVTKNFLSLLLENKRFFLIKNIISLLFLLQNEHNKILKGSVISVASLSDLEKKQLETALVDQFKANVTLEYKQDPSLAEGFIVRIAGHTLNTSFNNKIDNLNKHIKRNLSF